MDHYISLYIDNELSLNEKILFLEHIHGNTFFKDDAVSMLEQEKILGSALKHHAPEASIQNMPASRLLPALGLAAAACLLFTLSFLAGANFYPKLTPLPQIATITAAPVQHRFVLFLQESAQVEITGSFTNWQKVPLTPTGSEGYWEITLEVPTGEHRYSFIVDGTKLLPDPTVATRESDDFGAINSIITVES